MNPIPSLDNQKYIARDFFTYDIDSTASLAAAASVTLTQQINSDSDFFWTKACAYADVANDGTTYVNQQLPGLTITIVDGTTGRALSNTAVPVANLFGTAQLPFILPQAKYFASRATIQLTVNNITDNITYSSIRFSFHGIKAFLK